jgi:hypothetical protein
LYFIKGLSAMRFLGKKQGDVRRRTAHANTHQIWFKMLELDEDNNKGKEIAQFLMKKHIDILRFVIEIHKAMEEITNIEN